MVALSFPALRARGRLRMTFSWGRSRSMKAFANLHNKKFNKRRERNNKEEKKKKKMNIGSNDDISNNPTLIISTTCSRSIPDDDFVVCEILSRLPVKSLMRFKSVCKRWRSLIQHDPHFHELHFNQSKTHLGLFIVTAIHKCERHIGHREYFLSADLIEGSAAVHTFREREELVYDEILNPVNDLVCLTDVLFGAVCIYNPSTREVTGWIETTIRKGKYLDKNPRFKFGFDPVTKEHKVICVWNIFKTRNKPKHTACEVLTVGNNSWRRIDEVPPYDMDRRSLYINGAIYWIVHKHEDPEVLMAFDVGSEKFRAIPIPDFIIDQPREPRDLHKYRGPSYHLLEVDGCVALLCRMNYNTASMWIFDDDHHDYSNKEKIRTNNTSSSCSSNKRHNWTEVTAITLPFDWVGDMNVYFCNIPGTDMIIIRSSTDWVLSAYTYNWKEKTFKKVEINGISPPTPSASMFTPFAESLFVVN